MRPWSLWDYFMRDGRCPIREWYANLDDEARVEFDDTVFQLANAYDDWTVREGNEFKQFAEDDEDAGISEIRFWTEHPYKRKRRSGRKLTRRFRAWGLYRPRPAPELSEFIFLGGFEKEEGGRVLIPEDAKVVIRQCKEDFERGIGRTDEHS